MRDAMVKRLKLFDNDGVGDGFNITVIYSKLLLLTVHKSFKSYTFAKLQPYKSLRDLL